MKTPFRSRTTALVAALSAGLSFSAGCAVDETEPGDETFEAAGGVEEVFTHRKGTVAQRTLRTPEGTTDVQVEIIDGVEMYEGDMVLAEPGDPVSGARASGINAGGRWPGGIIPYVIDADLPEPGRVTAAIAAWEAVTPVRFVPYTNQPNHVRILSGNDACSSRVGRMGWEEQGVRLSTGEGVGDIVGIGIAKSDDKTYYWYRDGFVTIGSTSNANEHQPHYKYSLPPGKSTSDIVEMTIAPGGDHVFTWYKDGTYSEGNSRDLDAYKPPRDYIVEGGRTISQVAGIAFGNNGHTFTWYTDRTVSEGHADNLGAFGSATSYSLPGGRSPFSIVAIDIAGSNGDVYAWYNDRKVSSGSGRANLGNERSPYDYELPGHCGVSATIHELGHTLGLAHEQSRHDRDDFVTINWNNVEDDKEGNFDKKGSDFSDIGSYDFASIMQYGSYSFSKNGLPTIVKKDGTTFSPGSVLSAGDIAAINFMY